MAREGTSLPDETFVLRSLRNAETILFRLRFLMVALAVVMTVLFRPAFTWGPLALAGALLGLNALVAFASGRARELAQARRLAILVTAVDGTAAVALFLLFVGDPVAMPVAFMPFLAFELATRYGNRGAVAGLCLFAAALALRVFAQIFVLPGGAIRPPLLVLWCSLTVLMVTFSRELRARESAQFAALRERERIAAGFRATVSEVLVRAGVSPDRATHRDVMEAIERICDERSEAARELAARIADLLVAESRDKFGLTRREREILSLMAKGSSYKHIADVLFLSASTVRNHAANLSNRATGQPADHQANHRDESRV